MGLKKVAIKNERPGVMVTPALRTPDEGPEPPESKKKKDRRTESPQDR